MGKHKVTPDVDMEATASASQIMVSGAAGQEQVEALSRAIRASEADVAFVNSTACMAALLSDDTTQLPLPLNRLLEPDYRARVKNFDIHYMIVIGQPSTEERETEIAATVINFRDADDSATVQVRAEGRMRALQPLLPYLFLFVFYSTPETEMSATTGLGRAVADMIRADRNTGPTRLLILESGNLTQIARSTPRIAEFAAEKWDTAEDRFSPNPLRMYVAMIKAPLEEDDPLSVSMAYNPLYHAIAFLSSVIAAPMVWAISKTAGVESTGPVGPPNTEEQAAMKRALEATHREEWDLAYKELETAIPSQNAALRKGSRALFEAYPELVLTAQNSFSVGALREAQAIHGDEALEIERNRLRIYKMVASRDAYLVARSNMREAFSDYRGDSVMGLDEGLIETMALQGDAEAQWQMYWNAGNEEALRWLCRAADQSHPKAQQRLGLLFENGAQGVERNKMFAYLWYEKAVQSFRMGDPGRFLTERDAARIAQTLSTDQLTVANQLLLDQRPNQCFEQLGISETRLEDK
jgi:hypothetical protein